MSFLSIRAARREDCPAILSLIQELAVFEREPDAVTVTVEKLEHDGFGLDPLYYCWVAEVAGQVVGMSFCYIRYSTWKGPRLYLEDLIVSESFRQQGLGTRLLNHTIEQARWLNCTAVCWQVLDWNTPALEFYRRAGAVERPGWIDMYLEL